MNEIETYNALQTGEDQHICDLLMKEIDTNLPATERKIWHGHPVWFINGNPIVGYSKEKRGMRLMFWSGKSFEEEELAVQGEKFQDASKFYTNVAEINAEDLHRWLEKAAVIQWDYKNIVKKKGRLERVG